MVYNFLLTEFYCTYYIFLMTKFHSELVHFLQYSLYNHLLVNELLILNLQIQLVGVQLNSL